MQHPARGILCRFSFHLVHYSSGAEYPRLAGIIVLTSVQAASFLLFPLLSSSSLFLHFLVPLSPNAIIVIDFAQFSMHAALKTRSSSSSAAASAAASAWSLRGC